MIEKCSVSINCSPGIQNKGLFGNVKYHTCGISCQQEINNRNFTRTGLYIHSCYHFYVFESDFCIQDTSESRTTKVRLPFMT